jgi:hypothetical protein
MDTEEPRTVVSELLGIPRFQKVFNSLEGKKEEGNKQLLTDFLATVSGATALANLIQPWPFHLTDGDSK